MSRLEAAIASGRFVVTAELLTVNSGGVDAVRRHFAPYEEYVDAVNATDNTAAHAHASPLAVAVALRQLGMEPVMQLVCRDRNRLALQAEIAGAALHGIENICCLTGDDVTAGDEPEARRVFDLDGPQLISVAASLAAGRYLSGRAIDSAPRLFIGAVENPGGHPLAHRPDRATKKVLAGARFLQLQICFQPDRLEAFVAELERRGVAATVAVLPSIVLVRGAKALEFMDEEVPGISVPPETIARVRDAINPSEALYELALEQARHAIALPGVRGLHLVDFRRDGALSRLCTDLGIPSRRERRSNADRTAVIV